LRILPEVHAQRLIATLSLVRAWNEESVLQQRLQNGKAYALHFAEVQGSWGDGRSWRDDRIRFLDPSAGGIILESLADDICKGKDP